jgi:hypothetical protein
LVTKETGEADRTKGFHLNMTRMSKLRHENNSDNPLEKCNISERNTGFKYFHDLIM